MGSGNIRYINRADAKQLIKMAFTEFFIVLEGLSILSKGNDSAEAQKIRKMYTGYREIVGEVDREKIWNRVQDKLGPELDEVRNVELNSILIECQKLARLYDLPVLPEISNRIVPDADEQHGKMITITDERGREIRIPAWALEGMFDIKPEPLLSGEDSDFSMVQIRGRGDPTSREYWLEQSPSIWGRIFFRRRARMAVESATEQMTLISENYQRKINSDISPAIVPGDITRLLAERNIARNHVIDKSSEILTELTALYYTAKKLDREIFRNLGKIGLLAARAYYFIKTANRIGAGETVVSILGILGSYIPIINDFIGREARLNFKIQEYRVLRNVAARAHIRVSEELMRSNPTL